MAVTTRTQPNSAVSQAELDKKRRQEAREEAKQQERRKTDKSPGRGLGGDASPPPIQLM